MKKYALFTVTGFALIFFSFTSVAQLRSINMEATMRAPEANGTYPAEEYFPFIVTVKNLGPDALVAGDSVFVGLPNGQIDLIVLQSPIPVNQSDTVVNGSLLVHSTINITQEYCAYVYDDPATQLESEGVPVVVSYIDPDSSNNRACNEINITGNNTTSIAADKQIAGDFLIHPNPASSKVCLLFAGYGHKRLLCIRDVGGRVVLEKEFQIGQLIELDVSGFNNGIYLLELREQDHKISKKMLVHH